MNSLSLEQSGRLSLALRDQQASSALSCTANLALPTLIGKWLHILSTQRISHFHRPLAQYPHACAATQCHLPDPHHVRQKSCTASALAKTNAHTSSNQVAAVRVGSTLSRLSSCLHSRPQRTWSAQSLSPPGEADREAGDLATSFGGLSLAGLSDLATER